MVTTKKQLVTGSARLTSSGTNGRRYITVHQTGNTAAGADAQAHANLQSRGNSRSASWHYTVDDREAIQSYEHTARCWHAGDGTGDGNYNSIGVEHCVNSDGDYARTLRNGAELVARIADAEGIPTSRIVQHNRWTGKDCPAQLRAGKGGISWSEYLAMVDRARGGSASRDGDRAPVDDGMLDVDGKWGSGTTRALQADLGCEYRDGEVSRQNAAWRGANPGLTTGWEWLTSGYGAGSPFIRDFQQLLNAAGFSVGPVDGLAGEKFFKGLQRWLDDLGLYDGARDGELWKPSTTIKALQRAHNKGLVKKAAKEAGIR